MTKLLIAAPAAMTVKEQKAVEFAKLDKSLDRLKKKHDALKKELIRLGIKNQEVIDTAYGKVCREDQGRLNTEDEYLIAQLKRSKKYDSCLESKLSTTLIRAVASENSKVASAVQAAIKYSVVVKVRK